MTFLLWLWYHSFLLQHVIIWFIWIFCALKFNENKFSSMDSLSIDWQLKVMIHGFCLLCAKVFSLQLLEFKISINYPNDVLYQLQERGFQNVLVCKRHSWGCFRLWWTMWFHISMLICYRWNASWGTKTIGVIFLRHYWAIIILSGLWHSFSLGSWHVSYCCKQ